MNGWATTLAFWKEASIFGSQDGSAFRPPGIVQIQIEPVALSRWTTTDPLRAMKTEATLRRAWRVTLTRQFDRGLFEDFWLQAITDNSPSVFSITFPTPLAIVTRNLIDNPALKTYGMEFILEDGNQRRYSGMSVEKVEYSLQSGRVTMEEVSLIALESEEFSGSIRSTSTDNHVVHTGMMGFFNMRIGNAWSGSHTPDRQTTFSSQLIFQRAIEPAQFNASGRATRFAVRSGWEFLGRVITRSPTLWATFHETTDCVAEWQLGTSTNYVNFQANVKARLSSQPVLVNGQIDTNIDFQAFRYGRSLFTLTKRSQ